MEDKGTILQQIEEIDTIELGWIIYVTWNHTDLDYATGTVILSHMVCPILNHFSFIFWRHGCMISKATPLHLIYNETKAAKNPLHLIQIFTERQLNHFLLRKLSPWENLEPAWLQMKDNAGLITHKVQNSIKIKEPMHN